jgi:hypothetical protein
MEAARKTWTDSRLDDLKASVVSIDEKVTRLDTKVDEGFARLDTKVDERLGRLDTKVDEGFGRLDGRIDSLHHTLVHGMIALISIIAVLLVAFLGVVVTHL